jgi:hypothetical protein
MFHAASVAAARLAKTARVRDGLTCAQFGEIFILYQSGERFSQEHSPVTGT